MVSYFEEEQFFHDEWSSNASSNWIWSSLCKSIRIRYIQIVVLYNIRISDGLSNSASICKFLDRRHRWSNLKIIQEYWIVKNISFFWKTSLLSHNIDSWNIYYCSSELTVGFFQIIIRIRISEISVRQHTICDIKTIWKMVELKCVTIIWMSWQLRLL